jgi:hypothetical protein
MSERDLDARLLKALSQETLDTTRIEQRVRHEISSTRWKRRLLIAAGLITVFAVSYGWVRHVPKLYADAARDHQVEVVNQQPRRWRLGAADIETVTAPSGLSFAQAAALAPAGYSLERAKNCGLDGQRMLHLVFTNGAQKYSVYVRPHQSAKAGVRVLRQSTEEVAGFETGRFQAVVVTAGSASECQGLARLAASRL